MRKSVLILGGTTEARQLAVSLAAIDALAITLSLAGRTQRPAEQGVPIRSGGFGGAEGLAAYLGAHDISLFVDATHPYAARISANAAEAAGKSDVPLLALRRPGWEQVAGDRWTLVDSAEDAVSALGDRPRRVFLALGRQELSPFEAALQHHFLVRSVDPVEPALAVPNADYLLARGPFDLAAEQKLLADRQIDAVVCKNSGGSATYGKIEAARLLGIEVIMLRRPRLPDVPGAASVDEVRHMVLQKLCLTERGE